MATDKKAVSVYLDREVYARVEAHARDEGRSVSNLIERTLTQAFPVTGKIYAPPIAARKSRRR